MLRKFSADYIFDGYRFRSEGEVLVMSALGEVIAFLPGSEAGENVEHFSGMLLPGFVNCHCHLDLSHLKGAIPEGTGLVDFLMMVMANRDAMTVEAKNDAMLRAMDEMHRTGTVAVGDICTGDSSLAIKKFSSLHWYNFIEVAGLAENLALSRFQVARQLADKFESTLPQFGSALSPHAPYSVSPALMQLLNDSTEEAIISVHNQESDAENRLFLEGKGDFLRLLKHVGYEESAFRPSGSSSFQYWLNFFNRQQRIISVHNTFIGDNDIEYTKSISSATTEVIFCLCPNANLYIERRLPPVSVLMKSGIAPVVGTDSLASNRQLNIWEEVKTLYSNCDVNPETLLSWATSNGARALGIADTFGSFEVGKRPGLVHVRKFDFRLWEESAAARVL